MEQLGLTIKRVCADHLMNETRSEADTAPDRWGCQWNNGEPQVYDQARLTPSLLMDGSFLDSIPRSPSAQGLSTSKPGHGAKEAAQE